MSLREVKSLPRAQWTGRNSNPTLSLYSAVTSCPQWIAISGHEHCIRPQLVGKQQKGCLFYVHLAPPPLFVAFWIPASHWDGRRPEVSKLRPRGRVPCPQWPSMSLLWGCCWAVAFKHLNGVSSTMTIKLAWLWTCPLEMSWVGHTGLITVSAMKRLCSKQGRGSWESIGLSSCGPGAPPALPLTGNFSLGTCFLFWIKGHMPHSSCEAVVMPPGTEWVQIFKVGYGESRGE